jgi:hypothetical protein
MHSQLAISEVLTLVLLKIQVLRVVTLCLVVVPSFLKELSAFIFSIKQSEKHAHNPVKRWKLLAQQQCCILTKLGSSVILAVRTSILTGNRTHFDVIMTSCVDLTASVQLQ